MRSHFIFWVITKIWFVFELIYSQSRLHSISDKRPYVSFRTVTDSDYWLLIRTLHTTLLHARNMFRQRAQTCESNKHIHTYNTIFTQLHLVIVPNILSYVPARKPKPTQFILFNKFKETFPSIRMAEKRDFWRFMGKTYFQQWYYDNRSPWIVVHPP